MQAHRGFSRFGKSLRTKAASGKLCAEVPLCKKFKDVFAITLKVLLSLLLISLVIGIGFLVVGGIAVAPASCRQQSQRDAGATLLPVFQPAEQTFQGLEFPGAARPAAQGPDSD